MIVYSILLKLTHFFNTIVIAEFIHSRKRVMRVRCSSFYDVDCCLAVYLLSRFVCYVGVPDVFVFFFNYIYIHTFRCIFLQYNLIRKEIVLKL